MANSPPWYRPGSKSSMVALETVVVFQGYVNKPQNRIVVPLVRFRLLPCLDTSRKGKAVLGLPFPSQ